ncbi:intermembrane transport protein PqiB [Pseudogulbenkiania sp. NH8B]|uniref:intermembrane transport protein PqiB n=1 Tax=Pseudogulbenkiania sp. (strain NH8B) TaxID=748280 RepID=UPI0011D21431|nr:intermembrane transport protein PqiB [Pseudogulbenkiania sp. NH8B]
MTNSTDENQHPARTRPLRRLSMVWIVPIIAMLAGLWMIYDTWSKLGPEITLNMASAEGITPEKTTIRVLDVNIGKVTAVRLSPDNKSVRVTARLDADTDSLLSVDSRFWVVKPRIDKTGVSGLGTLLSGAYIQLQPGKSPERKTEFQALASAPVTGPDVPGLRIRLNGQNVRVLSVADPVLYQGFQVGRVETAHFDPATRQMNYQLFIEQPYDRLVTDTSRFWVASGLQISATAEGLKIRTGSLETLVSGGVAFDVPRGRPLGGRVANMTPFNLYPDQDSINEQYSGRHIDYLAFFDESVRGLTVGAPVEYRGLRIGTVQALPYPLKSQKRWVLGERRIPVLLRIEPDRIESFTQSRPNDWQQEIERAIGEGLNARLKTGSLLTGAVFVDLDFDGKLRERHTASVDGLPVLPTTSGGLAQIETKVIALLNKLNSLKLDTTLNTADQTLAEGQRTLSEVRRLTQRLDGLLAQPDTQQLPQDLRGTLQELQQTLNGVSPQSPAYQQLQQSLSTLNQLLREMRPVVRTLDEAPNALLFNRSARDPEPKGATP